MLSPKARAAADKIKSFDENDIHSLSEVIRHEVEHAAEAFTKRARIAEERIKHFTDVAGGNLSAAGSKAHKAIDDHPVPSVLVALGLGFMLGVLITRHD